MTSGVCVYFQTGNLVAMSNLGMDSWMCAKRLGSLNADIALQAVDNMVEVP